MKPIYFSRLFSHPSTSYSSQTRPLLVPGCLDSQASSLLAFPWPDVHRLPRQPLLHLPGRLLFLCLPSSLDIPHGQPLFCGRLVSSPSQGLICLCLCCSSIVCRVQLFATPRTAAHPASLSSTTSQSLLRFMSVESVTLFNHLIICHPLLLTSIFPSIRVFSNESALRIRWPEY